MNLEIIKLWETANTILTSRMLLCLMAVIATILNFEFLKKIPTKLKENEKICTVVFSIVNGIMVAVGYDLLDNIFPAFLMIFCPLVLVGEITLISEGSKHSYSGLTLKSIFNFSSIYWIVANLLGMCTTKFLEKKLVLSLTIAEFCLNL